MSFYCKPFCARTIKVIWIRNLHFVNLKKTIKISSIEMKIPTFYLKIIQQDPHQRQAASLELVWWVYEEGEDAAWQWPAGRRNKLEFLAAHEEEFQKLGEECDLESRSRCSHPQIEQSGHARRRAVPALLVAGCWISFGFYFHRAFWK